MTCEETKPFEEMSTGTLFSLGGIPYCDSCAWKGMDEEEKKRYEGYASSHVAEERRIYNQYLKLKNRFSGKTPSREREREREQNCLFKNWHSAIRENYQ